MMERCGVCRFSRGWLKAADSEDILWNGKCHRRAPTVTWTWPGVDQNDWCGEFAPSGELRPTPTVGAKE